MLSHLPHQAAEIVTLTFPARGRRTNSPPQFGQMPSRSSAHSGQKVHSKMRDKSRLRRRQFLATFLAFGFHRQRHCPVAPFLLEAIQIIVSLEARERFRLHAHG
jgi:hypothetical protein